MSRVSQLADLGNYMPTGPMMPLEQLLSSEELEELQQFKSLADNGLLTIHHGIAAIGNVLAGIGQSCQDQSEINADLIGPEDFAGIGYLLHGLGDLAHTMTHAQSNINHTLKEHIALTRMMLK